MKKKYAFKIIVSFFCFLLIACNKTDRLEFKVENDNEKYIDEIIKEVPINKDLPVVYITFDDGPGEFTDEFLDLFDKYGIKVTYFCTGGGEDIKKRIKKIYDRGHTLGVHSYTHDAMEIYQSVEAYYRDLNIEENIIKDAVGIYTKYLRFPYGSSNTISSFNKGIITKIADALTRDGFVYFDWNVSAEEKCFDEKGHMIPEKAFEDAKRQIEDKVNYQISKTIVLLCHDTSKESYEYMKLLVEYLHNNGFEMKGIDDETIPVHHAIHN